MFSIVQYTWSSPGVRLAKSSRMKSKKIALLIGSLRKESYNRKMANALVEVAPEGMTFETIDIGELPHYNQDRDDDPFEKWTNFRSQVRRMDGVLFVSPEYNRSVPGVLKNAIDIASRPYGQSVFDQKPGAVMTVSIGAIGGFGANHHLRQMLVFLNVPTMPQPEAYIGEAAKLFDDQGKLINDGTRDFIRKFMNSFSEWIEKNSKS